METYFNYEQALSSKKLMEAISIPHGVGPFCGFSSWNLSADGKSIIFHQGTTNPGYAKNLSREAYFRKYAHRVFRTGLGININFGCISRDGYIYVDESSSKSITIEGTKNNSNSDIIVVAVHTPMSEPVENPVTFRAFWSTFADSYYTTFYNDLNPSELNEVSLYYTLASLENYVSVAIGDWDPNSMCIIGIYGQGNNPDTKANEEFSLVPYDGQLTYNISLTQGTLNYIEKTLKALTTLTSGVPEGYTNIIEYLQRYHDQNQPQSTTTTTVNNSLPKGTIVMWYGDQSTIPQGWELCDGGRAVNDPSITKPNLMGRVPIGMSTVNSDYSNAGTLGGSDSVTLSIDQIPRHRHRIALGQEKWGDNANTRNFPMFGGNDGDSDYQNSDKWRGKNYTDYVGGNSSAEGSASAVDIRQSYCVVAFIIKTVD